MDIDEQPSEIDTATNTNTPTPNDDFWEGIDTLTNTVYQNLKVCIEGADLVYQFDTELEKCYKDAPVKGFSSVFNLEHSLLQLAASNEVYGLFSFVVVKSRETHKCMARYVEYGCFDGMFRTNLETIQQQINEDQILYVKAFNNYDVADTQTRESLISKKERKKKSSSSKGSGSSNTKPRSIYKLRLINNKGSVTNSVKCLSSELDQQFECLGLVVYVERKDSKISNRDDRYLVCQKRCTGTDDVWQTLFTQFKMNGRASENGDALFQLKNVGVEESIPLQEQLDYLSQIPNSPKWLWSLQKDPSSQQVKFEQKFSCSYGITPSSPRNRIIRAIATDTGDLRVAEKAIHTVLKIYDDGEGVKEHRAAKRRKIVEKRSRQPLDIGLICQSFGITQEEAITLSQNLSRDLTQTKDDGLLYRYYTEKLLTVGCMNWRVKTETLQSVVMNDYNSDSGEFKEYDFVHVTAKTRNGELDVSCSCVLYGVVRHTLSSNGVNQDALREFGCCHTRILTEAILGPTDLKDFVDLETIEKAKGFLDHPIVLLPSKTNVYRFSVVVNDEAELVTIAWFSRSQKKVISCQNDYCKSKGSNRRHLENFGTAEKLCPHLTKLRENFDVTSLKFDSTLLEDDVEEDDFDQILDAQKEPWQNVFDEETGLWKFHKGSKSKKIVSSDSSSDALNKKTRLRSFLMLHPEPGPFELKPNKDGECECGNVWYDEDSPDGILLEDGKTILYTLVGAHEATFFRRRCMSGKCTKEYDGAKDFIFCSTNAVSCSYEVGWNFVDLVMTSKQTFTGFVKVMNANYGRFLSEKPFMTKNTFIKWWFAWASAMGIDFRKPCFGCGDNIHMLACDGTKIGITLKQSTVIPWKHVPLVEKLLVLFEVDEVVDETSQLWRFKAEFFRASMSFFPELGEWVESSIRSAKGTVPEKYTKLLLKSIIDKRKKLQGENVEEEKPNTFKKYNPPRDGRAYYFTKEGHQLREPRNFTADKDDKKTDDTVCSKAFPTVSKKGCTYLFLWFCPCHGHCYGFHIIPKAEGRKDAAQSLYMFLKEAPLSVFYDFACSLEEYCRNRESGFFELTRFFHDIFHGYTHKCSKTFRSNRLQGYAGVNTSICEQFNSFLQCIKTSAKLMTQEHFTFYVQFFINQWNVARELSFRKKAAIAIASLR